MSDPYMPGIASQTKTLGNHKAKILIVMDHPDDKGVKTGKALAGPALSAFQNALHQADMITNEVYLTCLVPNDSNYKRWWIGGNSKRPARDISELYTRAKALVNSGSYNIVCPMGDLAHFVFTGRNTLSADRGYIFPSTIDGCPKVLPLQDIKMMVWSNYIWRYYLASDLTKAKDNSQSPSLKYDERKPYVCHNFDECVQHLNTIHNICSDTKLPVSVDIEVANFQVSHIGLSLEHTVGLSIPFNNSLWTEEQEVILWNKIARILGNGDIPKVGQNFIFDIHFLWQQVNIPTRGPILDTMMAHSILFPEYSKGLGFLASIYINVPSWKGMVKFKNIKKES